MSLAGVADGMDDAGGIGAPEPSLFSPASYYSRSYGHLMHGGIGSVPFSPDFGGGGAAAAGLGGLTSAKFLLERAKQQQHRLTTTSQYPIAPPSSLVDTPGYLNRRNHGNTSNRVVVGSVSAQDVSPLRGQQGDDVPALAADRNGYSSINRSPPSSPNNRANHGQTNSGGGHSAQHQRTVQASLDLQRAVSGSNYAESPPTSESILAGGSGTHTSQNKGYTAIRVGDYSEDSVMSTPLLQVNGR